MTLSSLITLLPLLLTLPLSHAATADQWRSRSIYQVMTDRFAPPSDNAPCNTGDRVYCGGTWNSLVSELDYIQQMGYDAVWISPTGLNLEGDTIYGQAYHGFWTTDPTKLNPHFGTSDDLKALSKALHDRGMYLMVDIAINALASTSTDISDSTLATDADGTLLFKHQADYHPSCSIQWGNHDSEQMCWLANSGVMLMDLAQENEEVSSTLTNWVSGYVSEYGIDGFRLDASKHMTKSFQNQFCSAAGLFCIGEVAGDNTAYAASYQGQGGIDSVFGFGLMYGFVQCFTGSNPKTMSTLADYIKQASAYPDPSVIGAFLDNQDLPRFNSLTNDKSLVYNAITGTFLYGGIPAIYYGLEQDIADGPADPANREALWLYNGYSTTATPTYARIAMLNKIRTTLGKDENWLKSVGSVLASQDSDIAIKRGELVMVLTNRGASGTGTWKIAQSGFAGGSTVVDLLSCNTITAGSDGSITVTWTTGEPFAFVTSNTAVSGGFCGQQSSSTPSSSYVVSVSSTPLSSVGNALIASSVPPTSSQPDYSSSSVPPTSSQPGYSSSSSPLPSSLSSTDTAPSSTSSTTPTTTVLGDNNVVASGSAEDKNPAGVVEQGGSGEGESQSGTAVTSTDNGGPSGQLSQPGQPGQPGSAGLRVQLSGLIMAVAGLAVGMLVV